MSHEDGIGTFGTITIIGIIVILLLLMMMLVLHFRTWRLAKEANALAQLYLFSQPSSSTIVTDQ